MKLYRKPLYIELFADSEDEVDEAVLQLAEMLNKSVSASAHVRHNDVVQLTDDNGDELPPARFTLRSMTDGNTVIELKSTEPELAALEGIEELGYSLQVERQKEFDDDEQGLYCSCTGRTEAHCPLHGELLNDI
jgi:hypothetical protein